MESELPELDITIYDVIFKTIYLFLDTNHFKRTANTFLNEIKQKYKTEIDLKETHAKTLILRPYSHSQVKDASVDNSQDNLVINVPSDEPSKYISLRKAKPLSIRDATSSCPDCKVIAHSQEKFDEFRKITPESINWSEMRVLGESIKSLQNNHKKLIFVAQEISKAISQLNPDAKSFILNKYHQQMHDLYSYPGNHSTLDMMLEMQDNADDKTEYQIESSVINSSNNSNKSVPMKEAFIPLESKRDVGDIPMLIDNCVITTSKYYKSDSTLCESYSTESDSASVGSKPKFDSEEIIEKHVKTDTIMNYKSSSGTNKHRQKQAQNQTQSGSVMETRDRLQQKLDKSYKELPKETIKVYRGDYNVDNPNDKEFEYTKSEFEQVVNITDYTNLPNLSAHDFNYAPNSYVVNYSENTDKSLPDTSNNSQEGYLDIHRSTQGKEKGINCNFQKQGDDNKPLRKSKSNSSNNTKIPDGLNIPQKSIVNVTIRNSVDKEKLPIEKHQVVITDQANEIKIDISPEIDTSNHSDIVQKECIRDFNCINWPLLKKSLFEGNVTMKMKLLQALRWKLIESETAQREKYLLDYIKSDILSINTIPPYGQLFLESFYCPKKSTLRHALQEEMARFINTLASLTMGRLYLERDESLLSVMLLPLLMGKLPGLNINVPTREFTMATIQKLSLSNKMREVIIAAGTVEWLINFIEKNHSELTNYEAEYSIALFTNLCINKEARNRCERIADRVVSIIFYLIETPHKCCISYINPILYSLLLNPLINEKAVARGISVKLKNLYATYADDEDLKKQLDAIISMHETHDFCDCENYETEDLSSTTFADYIEPELSQKEPMYEPPVGEEILKTFYINTPLQIPTEENAVKSDQIKPNASLVQIVKKNCVCNNKSIVRISQKLLEDTIPKTQTQPTNKRQKPPPNLIKPQPPCANKSPYRNLPEVFKPPSKNQKPKNDKFVTTYQPKVKPPIMRRSVSQPPIPRVIPGSKSEPTRKNCTPVPKVKKFVVNCCYKMDYVNAIAASPGQFKPQPLEGVDNSEVRDDLRSDCGCYNEMKKFVGDIEHESTQKVEEKSHHIGVYNNNDENVNIKSMNLKNSVSVIRVEENVEKKVSKRSSIRDRREKPLQFTDYHVVLSNSNSDLVGRYQLKSNKR